MMNTTSIQYISDNKGKPTSVIVPIAVWQRIEAMQTWLTANQGNAWDALETFVGSVEAKVDGSSNQQDSLWDIVGMAEGEKMDIARRHQAGFQIKP